MGDLERTECAPSSRKRVDGVQLVQDGERKSVAKLAGRFSAVDVWMSLPSEWSDPPGVLLELEGANGAARVVLDSVNLTTGEVWGDRTTNGKRMGIPLSVRGRWCESVEVFATSAAAIVQDGASILVEAWACEAFTSDPDARRARVAVEALAARAANPLDPVWVAPATNAQRVEGWDVSAPHAPIITGEGLLLRKVRAWQNSGGVLYLQAFDATVAPPVDGVAPLWSFGLEDRVTFDLANVSEVPFSQGIVLVVSEDVRFLDRTNAFEAYFYYEYIVGAGT